MGAACPFATAALYAAWDGYLGGGGRTLGAFLLKPSARTGDTAPNVEASGVRHLQHIAFQVCSVQTQLDHGTQIKQEARLSRNDV